MKTHHRCRYRLLTFALILCGGPLAASKPTPAQVSGPRDLLRHHGIDDSHFDRLVDGRPIDANENETLLKVIYRVCPYWIPEVDSRIGGLAMIDVERWAHDELDLEALAEQPQASRGQMFRLSGRVKSIEVRTPLPEVVERFELPQYYRCEFTLAKGQPAVIYTRNVPRAWQSGGAIDQQASAFGLFLKLAGVDEQQPVPVFVAPRIAWHPETPLGRLGMDVGTLDVVEDGRRLIERDREAFYQMLAAVGRAQPGELLRRANRELERAADQWKRTDKQGKEHFSVVPLFNEPKQSRGRLVALSGTARRVVRIRVEDPDIVARFGIDHYYEMAIFTDDSQGNPLVCCVTRLPQGMPAGDGPRYGEHVRVAAFFFKTWAYRVERPDLEPKPTTGRTSRRQLAPLLIAREPVWYPSKELAPNTMAGAIAGGLFVLALLGIWVALWRYGRGDKEFHDRTFGKARTVDGDVSLDDIGIDAEAAPDFSGLDEMMEKNEE